ncbi:Cof-type HAD-IIB family hydrolase [Deinococcus sp. KNUC1210]|nr:Cof-type HAD-IIB family hydrolase [Deinococcus sp. KNUC1210]ULH16930.1 Cof-type HAD-IIB family hydrolase [Deinococcus sp. KNUC1210]
MRLIATDLDGTLLRSDRTVSERTRRALDTARAAGILVVPVTARQPRGLKIVAEAAGFADYAICGNGAHAVHLGSGQTLFEEHLPVPAQSTLAHQLLAVRPEVRFASVRDGGNLFVAQEGYAELATFEDHKRHPHEMKGHPLEGVLAAPSLKLIVRSPLLSPRALLAEVQRLKLDGFAITHSGAPFLEALAPQVNKAWGVEQLCRRLDILTSEVLAFGDAPNDTELLSWAGRGVAMANAEPEALNAADEVTLSNDQDGVAAYLERYLDGLPS